MLESNLKRSSTLGLVLAAVFGFSCSSVDGAGDLGTGGSSSGGDAGSGGAAGVGGSSSGGQGSGGHAASGGSAHSGGNTSTGGCGPTETCGAGGTLGSGGDDGGASGGATGTGGDGSGTCQKGTTMGKEVLFIGESFIAASDIPEETTKLARAAGSLGASDSYVDKSVSGTWIGNGASNSIPAQYRSNSSGVRFVLMNGGGNDCWQGGQASDRTNALNAAEELFGDMAENGVEKIVYFFYPDPIGAQFNDLTACLDLLRPEMKALCDGQTAPECFWVDLRETWDGHSEYTSDGIHVAGPGNVPTATAIWNSMEENCVAP
ncbi:MAG TPA: SGNH/GDSL hydrolase family protein [Polyangiaceae bacterium]|nr:SGNH/GDSL hydrolase family protein [Polyangiaceae bacterium]